MEAEANGVEAEAIGFTTLPHPWCEESILIDSDSEVFELVYLLDKISGNLEMGSKTEAMREDRILKALSGFRNEIIDEIVKLRQLLVTSFLQGGVTEQAASSDNLQARAVALLNEAFQKKLEDFLPITSFSNPLPSSERICDSNKQTEVCEEDRYNPVSNEGEEEEHIPAHVDESGNTRNEANNLWEVVEQVKSEVSERIHLQPNVSCITSATSAYELNRPTVDSSPLPSQSISTIARMHQVEEYTGMDGGSRQTFTCFECGRVFAYKSGLEKHFRTHTGVRPYKCRLCGKSFAQKGSLKYHIKIHTGEKPFKCKLCGKSFVHRGNLNYHEKTHERVSIENAAKNSISNPFMMIDK